MRNTAPRSKLSEDKYKLPHKAERPVEMALVDRLVRIYWPQGMNDYYAENDPWKAEPIGYVDERKRYRIRDYDERRVAYFLDKLTLGLEVDPIGIDCRWYGMHPGPPEVVDGHHRYVAHVIYGAQHIPMSFGGLVVVKNWLEGKTDAWPVY